VGWDGISDEKEMKEEKGGERRRGWRCDKIYSR
jgi:hypothetical protein